MSSGFVTEAELAEARRKRQEDWDKVRHPDQPEELPEEPYDGRCLFERLKEQKAKKDLEFEEAHKLKNMIRGLDDDEVDFLDIVDRSKMNAERKVQLEETKELNDFRERVATLQEKSLDEKIQVEISKPKVTKSLTRPSQKSILAGAVVCKRKHSETEDKESTNVKKIATNGNQVLTENSKNAPEKPSLVVKANNVTPYSALQCIGILPGIGPYTDSSDSSDSDNSNFGKVDWVGRKLDKIKKKDECL